VLRARCDVEADVVVAPPEPPLHLREEPRLADALVPLDADELDLRPRGAREDVAEALELVVATDEAAVDGRRRSRRRDDAPALGRRAGGVGELLGREFGADDPRGDARGGDLALGRAGERLRRGDERGEALVLDRLTLRV